MIHVQGGIGLGQQGVAAVAENALDEVQIADQVAGGEEADLHGLLGLAAGDPRTHHRAQQQRDEHARRVRLVGRERECHQVLGRAHGLAKQVGKAALGHRLLVAGDRQPTLGDVERALGGAPIAGGVVQHPLANPVAGNDVRLELIGIHRQRQFPRHAVAIEDEALARQGRRLIQVQIREVAIDEVLDATIRRAEITGQQAVLFPVGLQQVLSGGQEVSRVGIDTGGLPGGGQFQIDVQMQFATFFRRVVDPGVEPERTHKIHKFIPLDAGLLGLAPRETPLQLGLPREAMRPADFHCPNQLAMRTFGNRWRKPCRSRDSCLVFPKPQTAGRQTEAGIGPCAPMRSPVVLAVQSGGRSMPYAPKRFKQPGPGVTIGAAARRAKTGRQGAIYGPKSDNWRIQGSNPPGHSLIQGGAIRRSHPAADGTQRGRGLGSAGDGRYGESEQAALAQQREPRKHPLDGTQARRSGKGYRCPFPSRAEWPAIIVLGWVFFRISLKRG